MLQKLVSILVDAVMSEFHLMRIVCGPVLYSGQGFELVVSCVEVSGEIGSTSVIP